MRYPCSKPVRKSVSCGFVEHFGLFLPKEQEKPIPVIFTLKQFHCFLFIEGHTLKFLASLNSNGPAMGHIYPIWKSGHLDKPFQATVAGKQPEFRHS